MMKNMSQWAFKRKTFIYFILIVAVIAVVAPIIVSRRKPPSCFDRKENQRETGIDCGGPCQALCADRVIAPTVFWARAFPVAPGIYNAAALVENQNIEAGTTDISYVFRLYDESNVLIVERRGRTFLDPQSSSLIFEGGLETGPTRVPARTFFEFLGIPSWERMRRPLTNPVLVSNKRLRDEESKPRLDITVKNTQIGALERLELIALLSDEAGNAVATSRTMIGRLEKSAEETVTFTWSLPFRSPVAQITILPRLLPKYTPKQ